MKNIINEVLKEFTAEIDGLGFELKGRISKVMDKTNDRQIYTWSVSHYCKQFPEAATPYIPSKDRGYSASEVESKLLDYMEKFRADGIVENTLF
jgi:hypothetical protein